MKFVKIFLLISMVLIIVISVFIFLKIKPTITGEAVVGFSIAKDVSREIITTTLNISETVNATINSEIILLTTSNVTGNIEVAEYTKNPEGDLDVTKIGLRYIIITIDSAITDVLDWATIYIDYTDVEVNNEGVDESTLRMFWFNATSENWQEEDSTGVNTVDNYVWANVTHFSTFGIIATILQAPSPSGGGGRRVICTSDEKRCSENDLQQCNQEGVWITNETCTYGCENNACKEKPAEVLFDIDLIVLEHYKELFVDEITSPTLTFQIELTNFGRLGRVDVTLNYLITDIYGNTILEKTETLAVETRTSFVRTFNLPKDIKPGKYKVSVELLSDDFIVVSSDSFEIIKKSIEIPTLTVPTSTIFGILIVIFFIFILILYYEYQRTKKLNKLMKNITEKDLIKYKEIKRR